MLEENWLKLSDTITNKILPLIGEKEKRLDINRINIISSNVFMYNKEENGKIKQIPIQLNTSETHALHQAIKISKIYEDLELKYSPPLTLQSMEALESMR